VLEGVEIVSARNADPEDNSMSSDVTALAKTRRNKRSKKTKAVKQ
jgi:hypothetical protein